MMAAGFARNGAKVYIAARKEAQLKQATEELNKLGSGGVHYIVANVGSKAGCDALASEIKKRENKLHVLVNNSGITWGAPMDDFPEAKGWDNIFHVNVKSIFYMTVALVDLLSKDATSYDPGRVINISSVASLTAASETALAGDGTGTYSYNASKAAANHVTSQLAYSLVGRHITVNAILPGVFPSKMTAFGFSQNEDMLIASQPTGRTGAPQDIAGVALFLASPASAHITSAFIPLDGGALLCHGKLAPKPRL
jgi:NAD(P)-dependent dehydrogenase (short-subunit alcohol dehydrogenase family)